MKKLRRKDNLNCLKDLKPVQFRDYVQVEGRQLDPAYLAKNGFDYPILVMNRDKLGLKLPTDFSGDFLVKKLGREFMVSVFDLENGQEHDLELGALVDAMKVEPKKRSNTYNCLNFNLSNTNIDLQVPDIVEALNWEKHWPAKDDRKPNLTKYCIFSMAGSFTDFHIHPTGASVWFHQFEGEKLFFFVKPTDSNLEHYKSWMQKDDLLSLINPELISVDQCQTLKLKEGQTLFIPAGYIHAVHTTKDSIALSGNFLHQFSMAMQLKIHQLDKDIGALKHLCFSYFEFTNWYALAQFPALLNMYKESIDRKFIKSRKGFDNLLNDSASYICCLLKWHNDYENLTKEQRKDSILVPNDFKSNTTRKKLMNSFVECINQMSNEPIELDFSSNKRKSSNFCKPKKAAKV